MARMLSVDDVPVALRNSLLRYLTPLDEAVLLPQAFQSPDSAKFKNICFKLCASQAVNPNLFPLDLFSGLSVVKIESEEDVKLIEKSLEDTKLRKEMLKKLADMIPSEMFDEKVTVGPSLDCGEDERDLPSDDWTCGFDSSSSFVGIYSAQNSRSLEVGSVGQSRVFHEFYLVCKAGGGLAASTFHSRLRAELNKGRTLEESLCEDGIPGACALRRVATAAQRNRGRIMALAVQAIGLRGVQTVGDTPSRNKSKVVVATVDVVVNSLKKLETSKTLTYQLSCCTDLSLSKGAAWLSNATDGLTLLLNSSGEMKVVVSNETFSCLPFSTPRTKSSRDLSTDVLKAHKLHGGHIDNAWIQRHFAWKNSTFGGERNQSIEPLCFFGSHHEESFSATFARELGVSTFKPIRLRPEAVAVAGVEPGKLRAISRAV